MTRLADSGSIVVTGMGTVTPLGDGVERLFDGWAAGETGFQDGSAPCADFDPAAHLSRREVRNLDRYSQLGFAATAEAVAQAGWLDAPPCAPERIGCVVGTAFAGMATYETEFTAFRVGGAGRLSPRSYTKAMGNALPVSLSIKYGWRGETFALSSSCSSGLQSVIAGMRLLQCGAADAVAVGGADGCLTEYSNTAYSALGATSSSGSCRPYDRSRDGIVPAEGAAVLLLERRAGALDRGATPIATLRGAAATSDAHNIATPSPDGEGLVRALREAFDAASIDPADLDYINTHGSGSVLGDRIEALAVSHVLGDLAASVPVSSTKSAIGHPQGAAGAIELIATAEVLRRAIAPPTLGLVDVDDGLDLAFVTGSPARLVDRGGKGSLAGVSISFGLGGHNAAAVLTAEQSNPDGGRS